MKERPSRKQPPNLRNLMKLNPDKVKLRQEEVPFHGHLITSRGVDGNVEENVGRQSVEYKPAMSLFLEDGKDGILSLLKQVLGDHGISNSVTGSYKRAVSMVKDILPKSNTYYACINDCILYHGENERADRCPDCNESRYDGRDIKTKRNSTIFHSALKKPGKMGVDKLQQFLACKDDLLVKDLSNEAAAGSPPFEEATVSTETATVTTEMATVTTEMATATTETATATTETATATTETATVTIEMATVTTETATVTTEMATVTTETATATTEMATVTTETATATTEMATVTIEMATVTTETATAITETATATTETATVTSNSNSNAGFI
ncbi:hypothetical protein Bbelb_187330 [Branchiostoma belcheri]|nr:hypothetical protein Bbelb_187330 [Branchiostoma belcheri]